MGRRCNAGKANKSTPTIINVEIESDLKIVDQLTINKKKVVKKIVENDK